MSGLCPVEKNDIITVKQHPGLWRVIRVDAATGEFDTEHFADPDNLTAVQRFMLKMWGYDAKRLDQLRGAKKRDFRCEKSRNTDC